jgi:MFS family permease
MINKIPNGIKIMLFSNSIFWLATNLLIPFLSIFYATELSDVTVTEIGISALIYYLSFGSLEPIFGALSDRIKGLRDEALFLITSFMARGILFILFAFATNSWHLYIFQFLLGSFRALSGPSSKVLYARFMRHSQSAFFWGIDESFVNISAALGAGFGGYLISIVGFRDMLIIAGMLTIIAGIINLLILQNIKKTDISGT